MSKTQSTRRGWCGTYGYVGALLSAVAVSSCSTTQPLFAPETYPLKDAYLACVSQKAKEMAVSPEPAESVALAAQAMCPQEEQAAVSAMAQSAAVRFSERAVRNMLRQDSYRTLVSEIIQYRNSLSTTPN
jgi:hypothetical protein